MMKTILINLCILLLIGGLSAVNKVVDFNNTSDLTAEFQSDLNPAFTNVSTGGLGNSGSVQIPQNSYDTWTLRTGFNLPRVGEYITLSGYFYNSENAGYGGIGFSTSGFNESDSQANIMFTPYFGASFHGGGMRFLNSNAPYLPLTWTQEIGDLPMNAWYKVMYQLVRQSADEFIVGFFIYSSDNDGGNNTTLQGYIIGGELNTAFANASLIYPFFSAVDDRFSAFDNFEVATYYVTLPVTMTSFTATVTSQMLVNLQWTTESETNNLGFNVYRSSDSNISNAVKLNQAIISGTNTSSTQNYSFTDPEVENGSTYYYWVEDVDFNNASNFSSYITATINGSTVPTVPVATTLKNAYPNPFNAAIGAKIGFDVKAGETATLSIFNTRGQLVQQYTRTQGSQEVTWNGRDTRGNTCGAGVYFYRLCTESINITKKIIVLQ